MRCRHCAMPVDIPFLDLGAAPPSNAYLTDAALNLPERWYPLRVGVCSNCWLVQTEDFPHFTELFDVNYAYFSSYSAAWLKHAADYVDMAIDRFSLGTSSLVVEVAANDGYLLKHAKARGLRCLGIEPTASTAAAAREKGIEIVEGFFGTSMAAELKGRGISADLMTANNVLAHVPDINDFVQSFAMLLRPDGVATFEFPHLLELVRNNQFDTIYHEHFSYLSLTAVARIFDRNGLRIIDVEELTTHGGSLRVFAERLDVGRLVVSENVDRVLANEAVAGIGQAAFYAEFQHRAEKAKNDFLAFLIDSRRAGLRVAAYGAAAKGNTLLNFAGVKPDLIPYVVDRSPFKQGKLMPGSRIPIVGEERLLSDKPDIIVILPWNIADEVLAQLEYVRDWGARLVTAIPNLTIR
ncbi:class I SAM-dependent methyltransferase [Amorphus sp. MBR-141]